MTENEPFTADDLAGDTRAARSHVLPLIAADKQTYEHTMGVLDRVEAVLEAADAYYDAKQDQRHTAEAALRQAVRALRRARHACAHAS